MTVKRIVAPNKFIGLSTDTKPTMATNPKVRVGDTFYETDKYDLYVTRDGTNWTVKTSNVTLVDSSGLSEAMFGQPTLIAQGNGRASWDKGDASLSTHQKSTTGWVAKLFGGVQSSYNDAAGVYIPVKEMAVTDLDACLWTWYASSDEAIGLPMIVWVHDPTNLDKRAEIGMEPHTQMTSDSGWNAHELASTQTFIHYGEHMSGNTTCTTEGTPYTWAQYQADPMFSTWTIYRISFEWGFWTGNAVYDNAYLADVKISGITIPLKPSLEEQLDLVRDDQAKALTTIPTWTFGKPNLARANASKAEWVLGSQLDSTYQKGNGWLAYLYGGVQSGDDYAAVNIPVNELPVNEMTAAMWSYYMSATESGGVNIVFWVHDPTDFDKRAEITQNLTVAGLEKAAGWNAHELNSATTQFFYYGENDSSSLTAGTNYTWAQFQADSVFSTWTIYRVSIEYGWHGAAPTFDPAYLGELKLNGTVIPLGPTNGKHKKTIQVSQTMVADAKGAGDVISSSAGAGVDWDFAFGGTGYITKAIATHNAAITPNLILFLFSYPPTAVKNDNVANTSPLSADVPYYVGRIDFPAMTYTGTGDASTIATPSTYGNLPLAFDSNNLYGILVTKDVVTLVAEALTIQLTAEMED